MKEVKIKKTRVSTDTARHDFAKSKNSLRESIYSESHRTMSELEFWKRIALKQQVLLHAKNKT
jgi:hypothetical protein